MIGKTGFDPLLVVRTLRKHWILIALLGLFAGASAAVAVWLFLPPPKQPSYTVLHILVNQPHLFQITPEAQIDANTYRQRQLQAVFSPRVLESVFANPKVAGLRLCKHPDRVYDLSQMISVDFKMGQEFMRITVEAETHEESLILVTAIKDAYMSEVVNKERDKWTQAVTTREESIKKIESQLELNRRVLAEKLRPFNLKPADAIFIPILLRNADSNYQQKESEQRRNKFELQKLLAEEKAEQSRQGEKLTIPDTLIDDELERDPLYIPLKAKTQELEKQLADNERTVPANSILPKIVQLRESVKAARKEQATYRQTARPRIEARLAERLRSEQKAASVYRQREIERYQGWVAALTDDIALLNKEVLRLTSANHEIEDISQQITRQEKQIADDRDLIERQKREVAAAPQRVSEQEPPRSQPVDEFRRRVKYAGMAGLAGFGLIVAAFIGLEFTRNRVSDVDQVAGLTLPVLGALPDLPPRLSRANLQADAPVAAEAIDTIRTMLLHSVTGSMSRAILISSAAAGEGKTTLSRWLATSLARAGYHTLLIDGDLRRPSAHSHYSLPLGPGLAEVLRGDVALGACWHEVAGPGHWVLPAGHAAATSSDFLPKDGWRRVLQEARERFDFVVVDSSPLLAAVDPMLMAKECDGVVLAVLRDVSRMDLLADAANRLRTLEIPVVGCVVHRAYRPPTGRYYMPTEQSAGAGGETVVLTPDTPPSSI